MTRTSLLLGGCGIALSLIHAASCSAQDGVRRATGSAGLSLQLVKTQDSGPPNPVLFRAARAITSADRQIISARWPSVTKEVELSGFNLGDPKWAYQQIVCPAFSENVLLIFWRSGGSGDRSSFSIIIPKESVGRMYVLPILRRGYSSFTPAPQSPMSVLAFDRALAGEQKAEMGDQLTLSLCYAALVGAHVAVEAPTIEMEQDGGSVVRFIDAERPNRPEAWKLTFSKRGRLVRAGVRRAKSPTMRQAP